MGVKAQFGGILGSDLIVHSSLSRREEVVALAPQLKLGRLTREIDDTGWHTDPPLQLLLDEPRS